MEKEIKLKMLTNIGKVYEASKKCKLSDSIFKKVDKELGFLSAYFGTTKTQSLFIAIILTLNYKGDSVDLNDLIKYFECNPMRLLEFSDELQHLHASGILVKQKSNHRLKMAGTNDQFTINEKISLAILQNEPMPSVNQESKPETILDLLEKLYELSEKREQEEYTTRHLMSKARMELSMNSDFPLVKRFKALCLSSTEKYIYAYIIWKTLQGFDLVGVSNTVEAIFDRAAARINYMQELVMGKNQLIRKDLIEIKESWFASGSDMMLTDYSCKILEECGIKILRKKKEFKNIIPHAKIQKRKLFFNDEEGEKVNFLKDLFKYRKFKKMQTQLSEKGLPIGVAVLLHGIPGTGKTEFAMQIAKDNNRAIMKVDISRSKSMFFGESEKVIKRIFTDYETFSENCDRTPILLFNEADAIISKRMEMSEGAVSQTQNAMQNILLEELENFEGILLATTNLVINLDKAFERRFLFKIQLNKPGFTVRSKIWKSKLPFLTMRDCRMLAEKFEFTGGQIDNILRKIEIHEIVHGKKVTLKKILYFCSEEMLVNESRKIGFGING